MANQIVSILKGIREQQPMRNVVETRSEEVAVSVGKVDDVSGDKKAQNIILEAEHFKAAVNAPTGIAGQNFGVPPVSSNFDVDDNFFHVMCYIEETLKAKIQRGEFVELDKLLSKAHGKGANLSDNKLDLVYRDSHSYFVPAPSENKITVSENGNKRSTFMLQSTHRQIHIELLKFGNMFM